MSTAISTALITGRPDRWARDLAAVGACTSAVAPALVMGLSVYTLIAAVVGAVTGAALGASMPALLDRVRGRVPIPALLLAGPALGAVWGGAVGGAASLALLDVTINNGFHMTPNGLFLLSVLTAAIGGALQFGLFWFPYTFQTVRGGRTWPVVLGACLMTPVVGAATIIATLLTMRRLF